MEEKEDIRGDIEHVEQYLGGLFHVPVGVCIADTEDLVRDALGYEIADMRRAPDPACVTAFQYVARIEWAPWNDGDAWRLMYAAGGPWPLLRGTMSMTRRARPTSFPAGESSHRA